MKILLDEAYTYKESVYLVIADNGLTTFLQNDVSDTDAIIR